ncbi:MAG TPA: hypothetical protein VF820_01310 [Patescibacteria group bacterium]
MRKVILFDIDYTLFNAQNYRNAFLTALQKEIGISDSKEFLKIADAAYLESRNEIGIFDPKAFLQLLEIKLQKNLHKENLEKLIISEDIINSSLYEDTVDVITQLAKNKDIFLGIFSAGLLPVQRPKIKLLEPFLNKEHIHIFEFKKGKALPNLLEKYKDSKLYMIDDIAEILYKAKQINDNITTILIRRENHPQAYRQELAGFIPDKTITNLRDVLNIVKE